MTLPSPYRGLLPLIVSATFSHAASSQAVSSLDAEIDRKAQQVESKVIGWRRDFHEHPELSNHEVRTGTIVADYLTSLGLEVRSGRLGWAHAGDLAAETILHRLAWSVALFITSPELDRLGLCANAECGWLFLDTTKNRTRRWCDMKVCGNREKVRRFRSRG